MNASFCKDSGDYPPAPFLTEEKLDLQFVLTLHSVIRERGVVLVLSWWGTRKPSHITTQSIIMAICTSIDFSMHCPSWAPEKCCYVLCVLLYVATIREGGLPKLLLHSSCGTKVYTVEEKLSSFPFKHIILFVFFLFHIFFWGKSVFFRYIRGDRKSRIDDPTHQGRDSKT